MLSFLNYQNIEIDLLSFAFNLVIAFILSHILSLVYVKYSNSLSNKKIFSKKKIPIVPTGIDIKENGNICPKRTALEHSPRTVVGSILNIVCIDSGKTSNGINHPEQKPKPSKSKRMTN